MARRSRVSGIKQLAPGSKQRRNKNPKLSPYQRELKRNRLANQAPRPFVKASAKGTVGGAAAAADANNALNPTLMYQRRDAPTKALGLMKYFQEKEERAQERKRQREAEEAAKLAYRERNEIGGSDDEEEEVEEIEEIEEVEESDDDILTEDGNDDNAEEEEGVNGGEISDEMRQMLDDLKQTDGAVADESDKKKNKRNNKSSASNAEGGEGSDSEIITDSDDDAKDGAAKPKMFLTHVPKNPSGKQLKTWMVKKERLAYLEMKEKKDTSGCEKLLKTVLEREGYTFIDPELIRAQRLAKKERLAEAKKEAAAAAKEERAKQQGKGKKRVRPVLEGELSAPLEDLNEEMLAAQLAPNMAAAMLSNEDGENPSATSLAARLAADPHAAFAAETARLNLKLLKKKEKKHAKKAEKRREAVLEDVKDMEEKMNKALSKTNRKKVKKERVREGDANYKLHQALAAKQEANIRESYSKLVGDPHNGGEDGSAAQQQGGHDHSSVLLRFEQYEKDQQDKKNKVKRLSSLGEDELERGTKAGERIRFGERAEAPPVFDVVPSLNTSFAKFALKVGSAPLGTVASAVAKGARASANPLTGRNQKINGVAVIKSNSGGVRPQQNKPGKAAAMKLAQRGGTNVSANIVSTAPRTDSTTGDISLYERKRLAKLGLMAPVTEQRISKTAGTNSQSGNANEMELLRQRVVATYNQNKKAARRGGSGGAGEAVPTSVSKSWLPTDRDY